MTKTNAVGFAVLFGSLVIICLSTQVYGCILPFLIVGAVFAMIAWSKHRRDAAIVAQAHRQQHVLVEEISMPPMTTKGSNGRLFVPPPLH